MAQLYFRYSSMNAGKSIDILKIANNYEEQGKRVILFTHKIDTRYGVGKIRSRVGLERAGIPIDDTMDVAVEVRKNLPLSCVLVDEGQFLTREQVLQFCKVVDDDNIPVIVYGLRADFQNRLFPGSEALLVFADKIEEVKTVCWFCNRKALMNLRVADGKPVREGEQVLIGGNESYLPVCRRHFYADELPWDPTNVKRPPESVPSPSLFKP
ncbi:MAG: thymidine kinase [Candidatus Sumerlaeota bacterium]|nr:thymidine kinase [Candidatus Sumerlaeota bacterium]